MRPLEEERCGGLVAHLVRKLHELVRLDIPTVGVSPEAGVHVGCQVSRHDRLGAEAGRLDHAGCLEPEPRRQRVDALALVDFEQIEADCGGAILAWRFRRLPG